MTASITDGTSVFVPDAVAPYTSSATSQNIFHTVVGNPIPEVTLLPTSLKGGQYVCMFTDAEKASDFTSMLTQAATFQISDDEVALNNAYFVLNGQLTLTIDPTTLSFWTVTFDYQAVPSA